MPSTALHVILFYSLLFDLSHATPTLPRKVWSMPLKGVAVAEVAHWSNASPAVTVTTFNAAPGASSTVGVLSDPATKFSSAPMLKVLNATINWPNQASGVVHNGKNVVLVADGFLVPGHGTGAVAFMDPASGTYEPVSKPKADFFYHQAVLADMNGDGVQDLLTARAKVPTAKFWEHKQTELLWFEAPDWKEHILLSGGPDVAFALTDAFSHDSASQNEIPVIVAAQFFMNPQLAIYYCATKHATAWSACAQGDIRNVTLDDSEGSFFNVRIADLNGDGMPDILATNNRADGLGGVFVYESPQTGDWRSGAAWTKHVLARGFKPKAHFFPMPGQGAPGLAFPLWLPGPDGLPEKKPVIVLSTDDGGQVVQLSPRSSSSGNWEYSNATITKSPEGTIGTPSAADVDGDGWPELFIPNNAAGTLEMWTWAPALQNSTKIAEKELLV